MIQQYEERVGDVSMRALQAGGEPLLEQVTQDLGVVTRHLARIRSGTLSLSVAVAQEIDRAFERAEARLPTPTP